MKNKISDLLTGKSPKQIIQDFANIHNVNRYDVEKFIERYKFDSRIVILFMVLLMWCFSISMIVSGIIALKQDYFWVPFPSEHSMLSFINIFWIVTWFIIACFIFIYGLIKLVRTYDE